MRLKTILCFLLLFNLAGCASLKEGWRGFCGTSTRVLEEGRAQAITKDYKLGYSPVVEKTKEALKQIDSYIYAQDSGMIAIYVTRQDTTPVGLFFVEVDKDTTRIEVSSPSRFAKELISGKVFGFLEGKPLKKEKQKETGEKGIKLESPAKK